MEKLIKKVMNHCPTINERGREILSIGRIRGYLMDELVGMNDLRIIGTTIDETASILYAEIKKNKSHYEFENGKLHLFGNLLSIIKLTKEATDGLRN